MQDNLRATMEYSNNFIANQLYLKLAESEQTEQVSFNAANDYVHRRLGQLFDWQQVSIVDGSGLSRDNRLTAQQINQVLVKLQPKKNLLKSVPSKFKQALIHAKTGTLDGVSSYAGFIDLPKSSYRFVFIFNRKVDYDFREKLLSELVKQLVTRQ